VAVKVLHRELTVEPSVRARFLGEGYATNRVAHPGVVRILDDAVAEDGSVFLVMELLDGETLDARWERGGRRLPVGEVVTYLRDLLDVLVAAHRRGVVHGDLKPENLFITRDGKLKVLDFGVARLRGAAPTGMTPGFLLGTPAFMPPEQALGRASEVDALSDIWAVGATGFALLTGRFVHGGETVEELLIQAGTQPAPSLRTVSPRLPQSVAAVIDRALAFEKSARWASAHAMRDALPGAEDDTVNIDDEGDEALTWRASPPQMTLAASDREILTLPPLPPTSSIAGITTSHGRRARTRRKKTLVGLSAGGGLVATAVILLVFIGLTAERAAPVVAGARLAGAAAAIAGQTAGASMSPTRVPEISVDALPSAVAPLISAEELPHAAMPLQSATPRIASAIAVTSASAPSAPPGSAASRIEETPGPDGF
jgi:serine/threonine-protein kinase